MACDPGYPCGVCDDCIETVESRECWDGGDQHCFHGPMCCNCDTKKGDIE